MWINRLRRRIGFLAVRLDGRTTIGRIFGSHIIDVIAVDDIASELHIIILSER